MWNTGSIRISGLSTPEYVLFSQSPSQTNHFWVIDEQYRHRHAANLCPALKFRTVPHEVFWPAVCSRMKKANKLARLCIESRDVGAFEAIAMDASKCQILPYGLATMLPADYVINLEWCRIECRRQMAVFATSTGSLPDKANQISIQVPIY